MASPEPDRHSVPAMNPRGAIVLVTVVCAGVTALWLRFNAEPPARGALFPHDLIYYFLPQMEQAGLRLAAGELPLWNPYPCAGLPLLASLQVAVFHPGTWLAAFLPAALALPLLLFVHLCFGGVGAALLFRSWGLPVSLAGAFGVVFGFACVLGQTFWPPEVATIVWVPWLVLCTERVMGEDRASRWWLGLVVGTALQLFAGFPQFALYGLQLLVPFAVLRGLQRARRDHGFRAARNAGLRVACGLALGAGIAMVQLAPTFELLSTSHRSGRFTEREVHYLQSEARLPHLLENAVTPEPRLTTYELGDGAGYLGTGTLVLIGIALVGRRRDPLVWCLAAAGAAWLMLSDGYLGAASEAYELYALIPGIGHLRAPERLLFPAFACWIALAACGAIVCDRASSEPRRRRIEIGAAALACATIVALAGSPAAGWRAAVAFAVVAAALALPSRRGLRHAWRALAALLLIADVAAATGTFGSLRELPTRLAERMQVGRHEMLSEDALAELRERVGLGRVEFFTPWLEVRPLMGVGPASRVHRLACYETLLPGQWPALSRKARSPDLRSAVMSNLDPDRVPAIYDVASVVEVVRATQRPRRAVRTVPTETLPNPNALPRAYVVDRFEVADHDEALDRLLRRDFDYRDSVLLDAEPDLPEAGRIERALPAEIVVYQPERVEVALRAPNDALLVLTDTDAPGWHAEVDGEPARIFRANGLFRAVRVPAGEHRVTFEYAPASLRYGALVSLLSAGAAAAVLLRARERPVAKANGAPD